MDNKHQEEDPDVMDCTGLSQGSDGFHTPRDESTPEPEAQIPGNRDAVTPVDTVSQESDQLNPMGRNPGNFTNPGPKIPEWLGATATAQEASMPPSEYGGATVPPVPRSGTDYLGGGGDNSSVVSSRWNDPTPSGTPADLESMSVASGPAINTPSATTSESGDDALHTPSSSVAGGEANVPDVYVDRHGVLHVSGSENVQMGRSIIIDSDGNTTEVDMTPPHLRQFVTHNGPSHIQQGHVTSMRAQDASSEAAFRRMEAADRHRGSMQRHAESMQQHAASMARMAQRRNQFSSSSNSAPGGGLNRIGNVTVNGSASVNVGHTSNLSPQEAARAFPPGCPFHNSHPGGSGSGSSGVLPPGFPFHSTGSVSMSRSSPGSEELRAARVRAIEHGLLSGSGISSAGGPPHSSNRGSFRPPLQTTQTSTPGVLNITRSPSTFSSTVRVGSGATIVQGDVSVNTDGTVSPLGDFTVTRSGPNGTQVELHGTKAVDYINREIGEGRFSFF